jgi:tRNA(fMet)-specific endonuclease VapC
MRRYLLDTNILSHVIKQPQSVVAQKVSNLERDVFCTSAIVACELRYGVEKKGSLKLTEKVELLLSQIEVLSLEHPAVSLYYGQLRAFLEQRGQVIGSNDMLIAAHALALDVILVTDNVDEFKRVPQLQIENWLLLNEV